MTTKEILEKLNSGELDYRNVYKALIAFAIDKEDITSEDEKKLNKILDYYYDNDEISSFIDIDIYNRALEEFED